MQNEELEFQKFMNKTLKAAFEFQNDYNNLSQHNKLKFQQALKEQAQLDAFKSMLRAFLNE